MILSLPVNARARRIALMAASVPELTKRIISIEGIAPQIIAASLVSNSVAAPKLVPLPAARLNAATTRRSACPRISGPQEQT
jgi:hypothetical protein